jgi:lipoprotein-anchoring transpeptidase ErfK/SrfK
VANQQAIVLLLANHRARVGPRLGARPSAVVKAQRPITGERTALPVLAQAVDARGRFWLRVRLPGRDLRGSSPPPTGWISAAHTVMSATAWHIVVDLRARRALIYKGGRRRRSFRAIVGKPSTPTPTGEYFVEESVRLPSDRPGAPYALATSARSGVLQEFDGGPGQIALHGLGGIGGQLGTAVSHGCVRLADRAVAWLAARVGPGVPVTIVSSGSR